MQLLLKLFIKNYEDVKNPAVREACGKLGGIVGIVSNVFLCILKIVAGILSNSIAVIADGINNLTDAASSVITVLGFKLAAAPEDEEHPYGHARIEYLTGLFISIVIIVVGVQLLTTSVGKIRHPVETEYTLLTAGILGISILVKIWQSQFNFKMGKRIDSTTLIAAATDSRNDVVATSAVLASVIIVWITDVQTDGWMGLAVAIFIIFSGLSLVRETASSLLGEAPDDVLVTGITGRILATEGVLGLHDIMVHNYGPGKTFASVHVEVPAENDIMQSHDIIDNIEREISEELNINLVIHMDPVKTNDPVVNKLKAIMIEELCAGEGICDIHDFRIVPGPTHTNVIFDVVLLPSCTLRECEIRDIVDRRLKKENERYFAVITFDKAYTKPYTDSQ